MSDSLFPLIIIREIRDKGTGKEKYECLYRIEGND
jgi:hypothetical protein